MNEDNLFEFEEVDEKQRSPYLVPWLVTGLIAVVALLLAIVVLNISKGSIEAETSPETPVVEEPEEETPPVSEPVEEPEEPVEEPEEPTPSGDKPDDAIDTSNVVIGDTSVAPVTQWDIEIAASNKLIPWSYVLPDATHLQLESELINSLPASCESQKSSWGLEKTDDGKIVAWSPQEMCTENETLYVELLGLVRAIAESAKPIG